MPVTTPRAAFWQGARDAAPFVLVVVPFAMVFGVIATEAGLNVAEVMGFSALVIAGASQFAAVQLMTENAPTLVVVMTALAVNLRMAMYSAALAPHLGRLPLWKRALAAYINVDQTYAMSVARYETEPDMRLPEKAAYYFGLAAPVVPLWIAMTLVGALLGRGLPEWLALDFAMPITFLAVLAPMLRTLAHVAAALTSVVLALALAWVPYNGGLFLAALAAMAVGAAVEVRMERGRA